MADESGDGVTIIGNLITVEPSLVSNEPAPAPPAPTAQEKAKAEAERLMADKDSGYWDPMHPKYKATNERVKQLWRIRADETPDMSGTAPVTFTPELQAAVAAPVSRAPSHGPDDPLAKVPETPTDYTVETPPLAH